MVLLLSVTPQDESSSGGRHPVAMRRRGAASIIVPATGRNFDPARRKRQRLAIPAGNGQD